MGKGMAIFTKTKKTASAPAATSSPAAEEKARGRFSIRGVLRYPSASEKAHRLRAENRYVFVVAGDANKAEVRKEIEARYGVTVEGVQVLRVKGKMKRFRNRAGRKPSVKKAIVAVRAGQTIDVA